MRTAWSASRTWSASRSASEATATASSPRSWHPRITRAAISPRFATRTRRNGRFIGRRTNALSGGLWRLLGGRFLVLAFRGEPGPQRGQLVLAERELQDLFHPRHEVEREVLLDLVRH